MQATAVKRLLIVVIAVFSLSLLAGCAAMLGIEKSPASRGGDYYPVCLVKADRALDEARMAGKDRECPDEFNALKEAVDNAYKVHLACNTDGACKMAKEAIDKIKALCPPRAAEVAPEEPLLPVPAAEPTPQTTKYCITLDIKFDIDKAIIKDEYRDEVGRVAAFMQKYPSTTTVIEGHTDDVGNDEYNMGLSQRRAESVVNYLVEKFGIDRSRLSAKGYGKTRPVTNDRSDAGRQKNRRIEAIIDCALVDAKDFKPLPDKLCLNLNVQFDTDMADIKPQFHDEIGKVAGFMKENPTVTGLVEGHTDNVGRPEYNLKLSQRRAESVVNYLVEKFGIERSRLHAQGFGETRRIAYNRTADGRAQNRRVNVILDCVIKR